ncbi:hypothetical protein Back11_11710 [Paenibacillus baekrokdamisoli]|uniref:Uncharacterized protein n=2 Tax=Paenibacillus baekrokdamisoli TaxID=1712516 RepID=A0A3G9INE1_9BACL|nr:hypothetical protein [Paenibacillus baekrokdamisoli]MBB3070476.1 hypothetical protein [Paenibacillus baekrokdamisoli]BBH19826.1 hypothetical protein Back11_11710 [Paenibacillus baekrokdamisoli]
MSVTVIGVRDAVIGTLAGAYPAMTIYGEEIKQGLIEPCFFVLDFPVSHSRIMGRRYKRVHAFDVHYFPSTDQPNEEAHTVAERLYEVLEYIPNGSEQMRGTGMHHEIIDGVLHFFFGIDLYIIKQITPLPSMGKLGMEVRGK